MGMGGTTPAVLPPFPCQTQSPWWEQPLVSDTGLPRFFIFTEMNDDTTGRFHNVYNRSVTVKNVRVIVVELRQGARRLPKTLQSRSVRRVLLETVYMPGNSSKLNLIIERAERVVRKMADMPLSVMAVDARRGGMQKLFDKLWLEDVEQFDVVYTSPTVGLLTELGDQ